MPIISENQSVNAQISVRGDKLDIDFLDEPSYVQAEQVILNLRQRNISVIYQNNHYTIMGGLPDATDGSALETMTRAKLHGQGSLGREILLHAPVKVIC